VNCARIAVLFVMMWLVPLAEAQAQTLPYAPPRVTLSQVTRAAFNCGVHPPAEALLNAYEAYTLRYLDTFRELDAANAATVASSSAMRGLVPDAKEERTLSQMRRRSLEHATRLTDELLDALVLALPAAETAYAPAFRDELHVMTLCGSEPDTHVGWVSVESPFSHWSSLTARLSVPGVDEQAVAAFQQGCRQSASVRRAAASALWRALDDARLRSAEAAQEAGLSGRSESEPTDESERNEWRSMVSQIRGVAALDSAVVRAHFKAQHALWREVRGSLPRPDRWHMVSEALDGIRPFVENARPSALLLPVCLDSIYSDEGVLFARTVLALPGLTADQRRQVRDEALLLLDSRNAAMDDIVESFGNATLGDAQWRALQKVELAGRNRMSAITGVAWLHMSAGADGAVQFPAITPETLPPPGSLVLAPEDDAVIPPYVREVGANSTPREIEQASRMGRRFEGYPPAPRTDCISRAVAELGLAEGERAVFATMFEDLGTRWNAEVEPRIERCEERTRELGRRVRPPQDAAEDHGDEGVLAHQAAVREVQSMTEGVWREAHAAWRAMRESAEAALPADRRDLAMVWIERERAEMCTPYLRSVRKLPNVADLLFMPHIGDGTRRRAARTMAGLTPSLVDQLEDFRRAFEESGPDGRNRVVLRFGRLPEGAAPNLALERQATREAADHVLAGARHAVERLCEELPPEDCVSLRRACQAQQWLRGWFTLEPLLDEIPEGPALDSVRGAAAREQERLDLLADECFSHALRVPIGLESSTSSTTETSPSFARASVFGGVASDLYSVSLWRIRNLLPPEVAQSCKSFERLRGLDSVVSKPAAHRGGATGGS